jgi:N-acetyltransferase 10
MSDTPTYYLFVLLGPVHETGIRLPNIICYSGLVRGTITMDSVLKSLSDEYQPHGDETPWKVSEQFQDTGIPSLLGA